MKMTDVIQITADNTDVTSGRIAMPDWTKTVRVQLLAPDSDWLFDANIAGQELARACGPHICAADNLQSGDWLAPHIERDIRQSNQNRDILIDINVVTAGVGVVVIQYES